MIEVRADFQANTQIAVFQASHRGEWACVMWWGMVQNDIDLRTINSWQKC